MNEISFNFPELFIIEKYEKIRFKNRGPPCYFLEIKISKILQNLNKRGYFCNILGFIFYGRFHAKTNLHSKFMIWLCVWLIFWTRSSIKLIYFRSLCEKMTKMCMYFKKETEDQMGVRVKLCMQSLTNSYSAIGEFLQYSFSVCG